MFDIYSYLAHICCCSSSNCGVPALKLITNYHCKHPRIRRATLVSCPFLFRFEYSMLTLANLGGNLKSLSCTKVNFLDIGTIAKYSRPALLSMSHLTRYLVVKFWFLIIEKGFYLLF